MLQEGAQGYIKLNDEADLVDAVDCMVSYFYSAAYNTSAYSRYEPLLHSQVATLADKYIVPGLSQLARDRFVLSTKHAAVTPEWADVVAFVYENTTPDLPSHKLMRQQVISTTRDNAKNLKNTICGEGFGDILYKNSELAMDLLLAACDKISTLEARSAQYLQCAHCKQNVLVHIGSAACDLRSEIGNSCPECEHGADWLEVNGVEVLNCSQCGGKHTTLA